MRFAPGLKRAGKSAARLPPTWQGCHKVRRMTVGASLYGLRTNFKVASKVAKTCHGRG
jgi:hypothetical protein